MSDADWLAGDSDMADLVRATDWSGTALGPVRQWPRSLKTAAGLILASRFPMIVLWGPQLVQIYNDGYRPILGLKHPGAMGQPTAQCWPEAWNFNAPIYARVQRGETVYLEDQAYVLEPNRRPETFYFTLCYSPIPDERGAVGGVLVTLIDTTRRVLAEREHAGLLARSEGTVRQLQRLFAQAPGFLAVLRGPDHVFELVNEAYLQLIGHREVVGKPVREALPEVAGQGFFELLDRVYASGEPFAGRALPLTVQRRPGAPLEQAHIDFVYAPVLDANGAVSGIFAQGHDVTEHQRAQQALRDSEERFRLAVQSSSLGTYDWDIAAARLDWSPQTCRIFGVAPDAPLSPRDALERIHPDDRPEVTAAIGRATDPAGAGEFAAQFRAVRPDGSWRWIDALGQVAFAPDGQGHGARQATRLAGVLWDVTEQHGLVASLQEADRRKDEFLAMLAHELRNPLAPLTNALRVIERAGSLDERTRAMLAIAERQRAQMARLVDDLLEVSRITRGKIELRRAPMDAADAVRDAVESVRAAIEARGQSLRVALPDEPVPLVADAARIAQVLENLLHNACKYTDRGGSIRLAVEQRAEEVVLSVADDGIGIAAEDLPRIFTLFSQIDVGLDRAQGGLGIGLALVERLVELHGGRIEARSAGRGQGATFTVRLPREAKPPL